MRYRVDERDRLVFVDDEWDRFAEENGAPELTRPHVLGRSLGEFVHDATTRDLYGRILERVRTGRRARFTVRCDGPATRRTLELSIDTPEPGVVEFRTTELASQLRDRVELLERGALRSTAQVRACGWCNRIDAGGGRWEEVEDAVRHLRLFEGTMVPTVTHGICDQCLTAVTAQIARLESGP